jgi:hypothetical protein
MEQRGKAIVTGNTQQWHEWVIRPIPDLMAESRKELEELNEAVKTKTLHPMLAPCRHRVGKVWENCGYAGVGGVCESTKRWTR